MVPKIKLNYSFKKESKWPEIAGPNLKKKKKHCLREEKGKEK